LAAASSLATRCVNNPRSFALCVFVCVGARARALSLCVWDTLFGVGAAAAACVHARALRRKRGVLFVCLLNRAKSLNARVCPPNAPLANSR
jgi:hypothetical protein